MSFHHVLKHARHAVCEKDRVYYWDERCSKFSLSNIHVTASKWYIQAYKQSVQAIKQINCTQLCSQSSCW